MGYLTLFLNGVLLNFGITNFYPQFLDMSMYKKVPVRMAVFLLPVFVGHQVYFGGYVKETKDYFQNRYFQKIRKLGENQKFQEYFKDL